MSGPRESQKLTLADLAQRTGARRRTIRYYIQRGLMPPPHGAKRGAWYDGEHANRLKQILHLKSGGLSLEAISRILEHGEREVPLPLYSISGSDERVPLARLASSQQLTESEQNPTATTATHIRLDEGLELVIDSARAQLTDDGVARFTDVVTKAYRKIKKEDSR